MKKVYAFIFGLLVLAGFLLSPYMSYVAQPDYGLAVSYRLDVGHKFTPLFIWRW